MVKKYKLSLPVEMSFLECKNEKLHIPVFKLSSWASFMVQNNCWHILTGLKKPDEKRSETILEAFWGNFRKQSPSHQVHHLSDSGQINLRRTIPIVIHGDEGRGRKHSPFLVISFHSLLGRGLKPAEKLKSQRPRVPRPYVQMRTNYVGHSYTTRYMLCGIRKQEYTGENENVFKSLMRFCAEEVNNMITTGVTDSQGRRYWFCMLHLTGDWPWLHKSGSLARSFHNCPKNTRQTVAWGLCHQCRAGQDGVPFEQLHTKRPRWLLTEYQQEPSDEDSPFRIVPHIPGQFGALWTFDWFHSWHLGLAKYFIGSALALISMQEEASNIEARFASVSTRYRLWCQENRRRAHVLKLTKEKINWQKTAFFPCGSWHKGELSSVLMHFLEADLKGKDLSSEPLLVLVYQATVAINTCNREMYQANLWLTGEQCRSIAGYGCRFLRRYYELARQSQLRGLNLFLMPPKAHLIQKILIRVYNFGESSCPYLNPLATAVQQDEDFIGRPSRLCRRVSGFGVASQRVAERYLQACYAQWVAEGYLIRPVWVHLELRVYFI